MEDQERITRNRTAWDARAKEYAVSGARNWRLTEADWGIWGVPEADLQMFPANLAELNAVELGCGTAYISAWMARRGAQVTGIDLSPQQLQTARALQAEHQLSFELVQGNCEELPFEDNTFDFAISEYGAAIWCEPRRWLREAFRVVKPGGKLHFLGCSPWVQVCSPTNGDLPLVEQLVHSYFDQYRIDWGAEGVEFNMPISEWFKVFREVGWQIVDYLEPRPRTSSPERVHYTTSAWGHRYPAEQVWKLVKPVRS